MQGVPGGDKGTELFFFSEKYLCWTRNSLRPNKQTTFLGCSSKSTPSQLLPKGIHLG